MRCLTLVSSLALFAVAGCTTPIKDGDPETHIKTAPVAVSAPCIPTGSKPTEVVPLNQRYTKEQWAALPPGVREELIKAQGGRHLNYGDKLRAATAACPEG